MKNKEIKEKAFKKNVRLWEIAQELGITDSYFSRKLRKEFSQAEKEKIFRIIDDLAAEKAGV